jgi:Protein of unknown function (DUF3987)
VPSGDLVDQFTLYTKGFRTSPLYRKWAGITLVAGAMERRVFTKNDAYINYPNLYIMLAGPPGSGKSVIDSVRRLWRATLNELQIPDFYVGVDNATKAALVDALSRATHTGSPQYNCLLLPVEEFSDFFSTYDPSLLSFLTKIYNAPDDYEEERRGHGKTKIKAPLMTALLGYQPDVMNKVLLKEGADQGFLRRTILIWNRISDKPALFSAPPLSEELKNEICSRLHEISTLHGEMLFDEAAISLLQEWDNEDGPYPRPTHHNLLYYNETRTLHALKLSMVASMSESPNMTINMSHVERAINWLLEAESVMPEVFENMKEQNSDYDTMQGLYAFALRLQHESSSITDSTLIRWLSKKVPAQKIKSILTSMEAIGTFVRREDGTWRVTHKSPKQS